MIEYWNAMNLAGDYARCLSPCDHAKIAKQLGRRPVKMVGKPSQLCMERKWEGKDVIVHRKGQHQQVGDVLGIIPGSMTADGFIVKGKGESAAVNSASHGAGRKDELQPAIASITDKQFKR